MAVTPVGTPMLQQCVDQYCVGQTFYTSGGLNIRPGPGIGFGAIETLGCGHSVTIREVKSTQMVGQHIWVEVETSTGHTGWAAVDTLDASTPDCMPRKNGSVSAIMASVSTEGGNPYGPGHYGIDMHSLIGPKIYSPYGGKVVAYNSCAACLRYDPVSGNATQDDVPNIFRESKYNYGFGAMAIVEYSHTDLSAAQLEGLSQKGVILTEGQSLYLMTAHLDPFAANAQPGTELSAGTPFAVMGNSGNSYGAHVHMEAVITQSNLEPGSGENLWGFWKNDLANVDKEDPEGNRIDPTPLIQ